MKKISLKIFCIFIISLLLNCNNIANHFVPDSSSKEITTGIRGQVFIGPVSPVEKIGVNHKVPYEAFLEIVDLNNNPIEKIKTDPDGKFEIELKPGSYIIIPEAINSNGNYPIGENKEVEVKSGNIEFVEIDFDSGIR